MKESPELLRVYQGQPSEKRSKGRPLKRWMNCVEEGAGAVKSSGTHPEPGRQITTLRDIAEHKE